MFLHVEGDWCVNRCVSIAPEAAQIGTVNKKIHLMETSVEQKHFYAHKVLFFHDSGKQYFTKLQWKHPFHMSRLRHVSESVPSSFLLKLASLVMM